MLPRRDALYHNQIGKGSLRHCEAGDVEGLAGQYRLDRCRHIGEAFGIAAAPARKPPPRP